MFYLNQHDLEGVHNLILQDICDCIAGKNILITDINGLDWRILRARRKVRVLIKLKIYFAPVYCVKNKMATSNPYTPLKNQVLFVFYHSFCNGILVQLLYK